MSAGLYIKPTDVEIVDRVAGATWWIDTTTSTIKVWDGTKWIPKAPSFFNSGGIWIMAPFIKGVITEASMQVLVHIPTEPLTIPATATNKTKGKGKVAATATSTFTMHKNGGASFGTIEWAAAATLATTTVATAVSFDPTMDDWFEIIGPATPDATLAHIGISVHAER